MESEKREIKDFECSETDKAYVNSLIAFLKAGLVKESFRISFGKYYQRL